MMSRKHLHSRTLLDQNIFDFKLLTPEGENTSAKHKSVSKGGKVICPLALSRVHITFSFKLSRGSRSEYNTNWKKTPNRVQVYTFLIILKTQCLSHELNHDNAIMLDHVSKNKKFETEIKH